MDTFLYKFWKEICFSQIAFYVVLKNSNLAKQAKKKWVNFLLPIALQTMHLVLITHHYQIYCRQ